MLAVTVTLKEAPAFAEPGALVDTLLTFTSALARTAVEPLPLPLLFPLLGSSTCSWSSLAVADPVKLWSEAFEQVTDHVCEIAAAVLAVRLESCTVCGPFGVRVQSAGTAKSTVVSTFAGESGPLLWTVAFTVTLNGEPALAFAGALTVTLFTLMSAVDPTSVVALPDPLSLALLESLRCSWSTAAVAVTLNWWLDGVVQVTDHVTAAVVVAVDAGSEMSCTVCGFADVVVQSGGRLREKLASVLAGLIGPLLCSAAVAETLNGVPAETLAGAVTETPVVFTSVAVVMLVVLLPLALLFVEFGSATCNWSMAALALTEKVWSDGFVQVTDQVSGLPGTVVAVDVASDVSCTVCGFAEDVVQSPGSVNVNVVSTVVGPYGPLLCRPAVAVTLNGEPPALEAGLLTVTPVTLMSDVAPMSVVLLPLPLLLLPFGSLTCSWSVAAEALTWN